jgi:small redox-active disulfide protein 2
MKKIQILGTGCAKCSKLQELTTLAADQMGIQYEMEKVSDIKEIMKFGVLMTPGLVVDGVVKVSGKVPSVEDIKKMLA